MMNYNFKIKMKNNKQDQIIFYNLVITSNFKVVMTKMTIFLAFKIKKYKVRPFSQKQNKMLEGTLVQFITKTPKNQWYNCTKKCAGEIERRMKVKKQVLFLKREQVKSQTQNLE